MPHPSEPSTPPLSPGSTPPPLRPGPPRPPAIARVGLLLFVLAGIVPFGSLLAGDSEDFAVGPGEDARADSGPFGDSVIVFEADDADESGVFAGRYDSTGSLVGSLFQVNLTTLGDQDRPDVSWLPSGDFVVVWRAESADGMASSVQFRRFDGTGAPLSGEVRVDSGVRTSDTPSVDADAMGRFTVVWADAGEIFHRRFDSSGSALGTELSASLAPGAEEPTLAVLPEGDALVAWTTRLDVPARRFDSVGTPIGREFFVHPATLGERAEPSITASGDGAFVVAYESEDSDSSGIVARRVELAPVGEEYQINTYTTDEQGSPSIAIDGNGKILVSWQSEGNLDGDSAGIFGRFLRPTGRPICPDALINTQTVDAQRFASVAGGPDRFLVVWQTEAAMPLPGQSAEITARILVAPVFVDDFESGDFTAWSEVVGSP